MKREAGIRFIVDYDIANDMEMGRIDVLFKRNGKQHQYNISSHLKFGRLLTVPNYVAGKSYDIPLSTFIVSLEKLAAKLRTASGYKYKRKK